MERQLKTVKEKIEVKNKEIRHELRQEQKLKLEFRKKEREVHLLEEKLR